MRRSVSKLAADGLSEEIDGVFEAVDALVVAADGDGRIQYRNAAADRFHGTDTLLDLFPEPHRAHMRDRALPHARAHGRWSGESHLLRADGQVVPARLVLTSERARAADPRVWLVATDLSEAKRIEAELRVSNERYELVGQATHDALWDWDLDTTVAVINDHYRQQFGPIDARAQPYEHWVAGIHPDDRDRVTSSIHRVLVDGSSGWSQEYRYRHVDGHYAHVLDRGTVLRNAEGKAVRMVGSLVDLTEREQLLDRMQLSDRLASIGILAAGVAHEINNPLGYAVLCVDQAAERVSRAASGDLAGLDAAGVALHEALDGLSRVRGIVRDLTTFAAPPDPVGALTEVGPVLQAALNIAGNEIRQKARLRVDVAEVQPVRGCPARLGQVVLNLLFNAAQSITEGASEQNEIRVSLRPHGKARVELVVSDTGCGLTAEARRHMFEPFFTTKPIGRNLGLGLAISHRLVSEMGGELTAESNPGAGTTFRIVLPAADGPSQITPPVEPQAAPPVSRRMRVLVIDDEPLICKAVESLLRPEHDVAVATSAEAAVDLACEQTFDLILCDLLMPGMTGMDLYDELARRAPSRLQALVFMTGGTSVPRAFEFLRRTGVRCLEKPFGAAELRALVRPA